MLNQLRGALRCMLALISITVGFLVMLLLERIPIDRPAYYRVGRLMIQLARSFNLLFNVRVTCSDVERLQTHRGFLFPTHTSFLDVICLLSVTPLRLVVAQEARNYPLIGHFIHALGAIFVDRINKSSRTQTRRLVRQHYQVQPYPAFVIFPEGKLGPGDHLLPFFYGAFAVAISCNAPYIPIAIKYSHPAISTWCYGGKKAGLMSALWRLATFPGPLHSELILLPTVQPKPDDLPQVLANSTKEALENALGYEHSANEIAKVS